MDHRMIDGMMRQIAPVIRESVGSMVAPVQAAVADLAARVAAVEARAPIPGPPGEAGPPGPAVEAAVLNAAVQEAVAMVPAPKDGIDGKDGKDGSDGKDADEAKIAAEVQARVVEVLPGMVASAVPKSASAQEIEDSVIGRLSDKIADVAAPMQVAAEMNAAIAILSEPAPVKQSDPVAAALSVSPPRPRSFRFVRNAQNQITEAHEEYGS